MKKSCRLCSWGFAFRVSKGGLYGRCGRIDNPKKNKHHASDFCSKFKPVVGVEKFFEPVRGRFGSITYEPKGIAHAVSV